MDCVRGKRLASKVGLRRVGFVFFAAALALFAGERASAVSVEIFWALPIVVTDVSDEPAAYRANGIGMAVTTLDRESAFGITVAGIAYSPFFAESIKKSDADASDQYGISDIFALPFGFYLSLGCSVLPIETRTIFFPVTISFHSKTDFLKPETHIDIGIAATAGVKYQIWRLNFFARAEIFFDVYRIVIPRQGRMSTAGPSIFGVVPQAGVGFTF